MSTDVELAGALRGAMRMLTAEIEPSERLLSGVEAIGQSPKASGRHFRARLTRRSRRFLIAVPLPLVGLAAGAMMLLTGATVGPSPAFAVLANGSVRVTIGQLIGVTAANAQLRRLRVSSIVVVPMTASCPLSADLSYMVPSLLKPSPKIVLTPQTILPGSTVVLAAAAIGRNRVQMAVGRFRRRSIPRCVSTHAPPLGLGSRRPTAAQYALLIAALKSAAATVHR